MNALRTRLAKFYANLDSTVVEWAKIAKEVDHLLSVADQDDQVETPAPAVRVVTPPVQPITTPAAAAPAAYPLVMGLHATEWLNKSDDESGETARQPMYVWAPRNFKGCGLVTIGIAAPMHVQPGDGMRVRVSATEFKAAGPWVYGHIIEGGPHRTNDTYLITGGRPIAESTDKNHAALDFTPAFMSLLNGKTPQQNFDAEESLTVDAQFVPAAEMPDAVHLAVPAPGGLTATELGTNIVYAARHLPDPFPYAPETRGGNLGCADVVSTALRTAGVPIPIILGVDDVVAALRKLGWHDVPEAAAADGNVIVWSAIPESNGHKHIGIIAHQGSQLSAINNSSSEKKPIEEILATKQRRIERVLSPP